MEQMESMTAYMTQSSKNEQAFYAQKRMREEDKENKERVMDLKDFLESGFCEEVQKKFIRQQLTQYYMAQAQKLAPIPSASSSTDLFSTPSALQPTDIYSTPSALMTSPCPVVQRPNSTRLSFSPIVTFPISLSSSSSSPSVTSPSVTSTSVMSTSVKSTKKPWVKSRSLTN